MAKKLPYFCKYIWCNREEVKLWRLNQAIKYFKKKKDWKI
jgi:hypothetical protein